MRPGFGFVKTAGGRQANHIRTTRAATDPVIVVDKRAQKSTSLCNSQPNSISVYLLVAYIGGFSAAVQLKRRLAAMSRFILGEFLVGQVAVFPLGLGEFLAQRLFPGENALVSRFITVSLPFTVLD